jgi:hypothetical protein
LFLSLDTRLGRKMIILKQSLLEGGTSSLINRFLYFRGEQANGLRLRSALWVVDCGRAWKMLDCEVERRDCTLC